VRQRSDVIIALHRDEMYEFLKDIIPKEAPVRGGSAAAAPHASAQVHERRPKRAANASAEDATAQPASAAAQATPPAPAYVVRLRVCVSVTWLLLAS
jgi:hypothetical protein